MSFKPKDGKYIIKLPKKNALSHRSFISYAMRCSFVALLAWLRDEPPASSAPMTCIFFFVARLSPLLILTCAPNWVSSPVGL